MDLNPLIVKREIKGARDWREAAFRFGVRPSGRLMYAVSTRSEMFPPSVDATIRQAEAWTPYPEASRSRL